MNQKNLSLFFFVAVFGLTLVTLGGAPALWWDEGWTISVAKNWVESGHYGQTNLGQPAPPGLSGHLPVVASTAFSFSLFGSGTFQARLPFLLATVLAFYFLFQFTKHVWNERVAYGALFSLLLLIPHPKINPLLNGRQVLGDIPAAMLLLAGYYFFALALDRRPWLAIPTAIFWGIGLAAKAQTLPFWTLSAAVLAASYLIFRRWRPAFLALLAAGGAYWFYRWFITIPLPSQRIAAAPAPALEGYYEVVAIVPVPFVRQWALLFVFLFALPTFAGLVYAAWSLWKDRAPSSDPALRLPIRLSLYFLAGSWVGWYLLFSNAGQRYLATPVFLAAPFTALLLEKLTSGYRINATFQAAASVFRTRRIDRKVFAGWAGIFLIFPLFVATSILFISALRPANQPLEQTIAYINGQTDAASVIESYESELFPFLERTYHFPPDQVHVDYTARRLYGAPVANPYDPTPFGPDYIVVGPTGDELDLYDGFIEAGQFLPVEQFGPYQIYRRATE